MWFRQIKNVISSCRRCSIHNTPAHWKCWCNGGEQGWMSTAHHKEATSVDHTNTFHPFGVKEIRKKQQLGDKETVIELVCVFSTSWSPNSNTCECHSQRTWTEEEQEEQRKWGRSPLLRTRGRAYHCAHTNSRTATAYTHILNKHWLHKAVVKTKVHRADVKKTLLQAKSPNFLPSNSFFSLLEETRDSDYWIITVFFFQHVKFKEIWTLSMAKNSNLP